MFEDATFDSNHIQPTKAPQWMLFTLAINLMGLTALIVVPLLRPGSLPSTTLAHILYVPTPPAAPVALAAALARPTVQQPLLIRNPFEAPTRIPISTKIDPDPGPPSEGAMDLNSGAQTDQVAIGSTSPATNLFRAAPQPIVKPAARKTLMISGGVASGLLLSHPSPAYPAIAKAAGVSGTVVLAATISKTGSIENLRVVSGNPMLRQAAVEAVQSWRYRPYQLNSEPVDVETTVNLVFNLNNR